MTQEQKELLLKDLCARLPYRVVVSFKNSNTKEAFNQILDHTLVHMTEYIPYVGGIEIKPYLRPMSSMTEEELYEVQGILGEGVEIREGFLRNVYSAINSFTYLELQAVFDWFNSHHFDYRGLIPMDLAIEVTEKNNPYKN